MEPSEDEDADTYNSALFSCLGSAGTSRHHFCTLLLLASITCPNPALSWCLALLNPVGSLTPALLTLISELILAEHYHEALPKHRGDDP